MLVLTVNLTIRPDQIDSFMSQARENARLSKAESGCQEFQVLVDPNNAASVLLYEIYDDAAAFEAHQQTSHFKSYLTDAVPLLAARERHFWKAA